MGVSYIHGIMLEKLIKVTSNNLLPAVTDKTHNFESAVSFGYNDHFLKLSTDEVTMTLTSSGVEVKKGDTVQASTTYKDLKLFKKAVAPADPEQAAADTEISLAAITMKRALSKFKNPILNSQKRIFSP